MKASLERSNMKVAAVKVERLWYINHEMWEMQLLILASQEEATYAIKLLYDEKTETDFD